MQLHYTQNVLLGVFIWNVFLAATELWNILLIFQKKNVNPLYQLGYSCIVG